MLRIDVRIISMYKRINKIIINIVLSGNVILHVDRPALFFIQYKFSGIFDFVPCHVDVFHLRILGANGHAQEKRSFDF